MSGRFLIAAVLLVTLLLCLAGCGGGGDDGTDAAEAQAGTGTHRTIGPVRCDLHPQQCI